MFNKLAEKFKKLLYADVVYEHEYRATNYSVLLILATAVVLSFAGLYVYKGLAKSEIFPKKSDRYDVQTLWVGIADELCENLGDSPLLGSRIEECVKKLSLNENSRSKSWVQYDIPDLDHIMDTYIPSFGGNLKRVKEGGKEIYKKIYQEKRPTVIGINIPAKYYKVNRVDDDFYALVYNQALFARVCVDGRCNHRSTHSKYGGHSFPLTVVNENTLTGGYIPIYIFIEHLKQPYSLNLQDGVFVAKESNLRRINRLYPINLNSESFIFAFGFLGVLLLSLWQAVVWRKYADYSAFVYFCGSLTALAIAQNGSLFPMKEQWYAFWWLNVFWAHSFFALTFLRHRKLNIWTAFVLPLFLSNVAVYFFLSKKINLFSLSHNTPIQIFTFFVSILTVIVPAAIFAAGAFRAHLEVSVASRRSDVVALIRRRNSSIVFLFLVLIFGVKFLLYSQMLFSDIANYNDQFSLWSLFAITGMMAMLYHPTFARIKKTLDHSYPKTEVDRLKLLLPKEQFQVWLSEPKSAVFLELDIAASSRLTRVMQERFQAMMETLNYTVIEDLHSAGLHVVMAKPIGDAYIYIVDLNNRELTTVGDQVIDLVTKNWQKYDSLVKSFYRSEPGFDDGQFLKEEEVYNHFMVAMVQSYTLGSASESIDHEFKDKIEQIMGTKWDLSVSSRRVDFISAEMNYILKLIPKATAGFLNVAGKMETVSLKNKNPTLLKTTDIGYYKKSLKAANSHLRDVT